LPCEYAIEPAVPCGDTSEVIHSHAVHVAANPITASGRDRRAHIANHATASP
jgi:hypothetical protein